MIKIDNVDIVGWEPAIRGMRNPKNSWDRSDSPYNKILSMKCEACSVSSGSDDTLCNECWIENTIIPKHFMIGPNDHELMMKLVKGGSVHAKFRRMIMVYVDIIAPLYWWKEFDTYKVGTVSNSCSTMHKIQDKEFTIDDFSHEHLMDDVIPQLMGVQHELNHSRIKYLETKDKRYWWQMIQLLPSSYNQRRTIMMSYEVLANIYNGGRKNHKQDEWKEFCKWIESLPYSELITTKKETVEEE